MPRKITFLLLSLLLVLFIFTGCKSSKYNSKCGCPAHRGIVG
ncbi:MAG: hypothetical protein ABIY35_06050 [Chitinophagaceae bacterium]